MGALDRSALGWPTLRELAAARRQGLPLREVATLLAEDPDLPAHETHALRRLAAAWQTLPAAGAGW